MNHSLTVMPWDTNATKLPNLFEEGSKRLALLPAENYNYIPRVTLQLWCHRHARYGLPTIETVEWLKEKIGSRSAIEVGSGAGDLAYHLGIRGTDSKIQNQKDVKAYYDALSQPIVEYPDDIEKLEALEAVKKYKPQIVLGSWITHWIDPNKMPPVGGGSVYGIREDELVKTGVTYIMIGNRRVHQFKPIMNLPHQEIRLPFIRSRASAPEEDRVWIWGDNHN